MQVPGWFPVEGKTYLVLGLGRSGLAAIRWLKDRGAFSLAVDDNDDRLAEAGRLGARLPPSEGIAWPAIAALLSSPSILSQGPSSHPLIREARRRNIPIIGEGDLFRLTYPGSHLIGITGTNGKSTTTALVGHILRESGRECQIGGNIGIPLLDLPASSLYVLELSSYQLALYNHLNLNTVGWLNISPDHLDWHGTLENYVAAKKRIFMTTCPNPVAVMGIDDPVLEALWQEVCQKQKAVPVSVKHSLESGLSVQEGFLKEDQDTILDLNTLPRLRGQHNHQNVAVAYGICQALKVAREDIIRGIQTFPGLAHRQEWIRSLQGIQFINDSKATNADATAQALTTFDQIYWIAGGKAKSDGIGSLAPFFPKIVHAFLIGEAQERFAETLAGKVPFTKAGTLQQAVTQAYALAKNNQTAGNEPSTPVVLLSPACASYDQFQDFEHRGNVFRELVAALEEKA